MTGPGHCVDAEVKGAAATGVVLKPRLVHVVGDLRCAGPEVAVDGRLGVGEDVIQQREARRQGVHVRCHLLAEQR